MSGNTRAVGYWAWLQMQSCKKSNQALERWSGLSNLACSNGSYLTTRVVSRWYNCSIQSVRGRTPQALMFLELRKQSGRGLHTTALPYIRKDRRRSTADCCNTARE